MAKFEELNVQYMKRIFLIACCSLLVFVSFGQTITQKLQKAFAAFEKDSQLKHAISSLYVIDANSGQVVFNKNSQVGLAPASTQKIITSVTAFELLGKDYRYKTELKLIGEVSQEKFKGDIIFICSGDPTFGSWRYSLTQKDKILNEIILSFRQMHINRIDEFSSQFSFDNSKFEKAKVPDGWIWQDIGNYYGAGSGCMNWGENQFDIKLKSGSKVGDSVTITNIDSTDIILEYYGVDNEIKSAAQGSGDNAYIYYPFFSKTYLKGSIPINQNGFTISGAIADPQKTFSKDLLRAAIESKYPFPSGIINTNDNKNKNEGTVIYTHYSPSLYSIIYWFNKKSINLYGEALIKTFAYEKKGFGSTDSGVVIVKDFWKEKGLDKDELGIVDGSGLSPLNRVTTHSQVEILKYAKAKDWFPYFYNSLPEYNGMTMKSGTIRGVKGFCGYHKAKNGKEFIFSFLVNNYNGSASALVNKMYKVLDILK